MTQRRRLKRFGYALLWLAASVELSLLMMDRAPDICGGLLLNAYSAAVIISFTSWEILYYWLFGESERGA